MSKNDSSSERMIRDHRRQWKEHLYVYPVISRRAGGLSVGVNLNPDKRCNFACLYCQINRRIRRNLDQVDIERLKHELTAVLSEAASGEIWNSPRFQQTPGPMRRINDIAFSGDGEPTCLPNFDEAIQTAAECKKQQGLSRVKIVVITNATQLQSPQVLRAIPVLRENDGEFWAKLDAGTDAYFQTMNRPHPKVEIETITQNIAAAAQRLPIVIQTLFTRLDGVAPSDMEIGAYCERLRKILDTGGKVKLVQLHTIARSPESSRVRALSNDQLDAIADTVRSAVPELSVEVYYGQDVEPQAK